MNKYTTSSEPMENKIQSIGSMNINLILLFQCRLKEKT